MEEKQKGMVIIERTFSYENMAIPFNIYIDDQKIGEIKQHKTESFELEYGEHTIYFNLQGKMQSGFKSIKKTFVISTEKPNVNVKCRIWGYGLLWASLFIKDNHIIVTID